MKPLFDKEGLQVLRQFAWSNVLLAFDFDGTLAPIVTEPGEARMRRCIAARASPGRRSAGLHCRFHPSPESAP